MRIAQLAQAAIPASVMLIVLGLGPRGTGAQTLTLFDGR
jgi:hypothetical protein